MGKIEKEIRSFGPEFRATLKEGSERTIEFYPIVFNQESQLLYDYWEDRSFKEIIRPEALSMDFVDRQDIKCNRDHNNGRLLGRRNNGQGTLQMSIDDKGVKCSLELPNTEAGNETLELVKRGDLTGCSFAFQYDENKLSTTRQKDGTYLREVKGFSALFDVSIVTDPAYLGTSVYKRDFETVINAEAKPKAEADWRKDEAFLSKSLKDFE